MVRHYILLSSSYTNGTRIAYDITSTGAFDKSEIQTVLESIWEICGKEAPVATHCLYTNSDTWESVQAYDPFFATVERVDDVQEFAKLILQDRTLQGLDVAKYILSKQRCTHLQLEKLVYFCYAEYLCEYQEPLFRDNIYAFTFGPVVESVYEKYKNHGRQVLADDTVIQSSVQELPAKSRILFAKDGIAKADSIQETLRRYGKCSAAELVELTHRQGSPWSMVDSTKPFQIISDELILQQHHIEQIEP